MGKQKIEMKVQMGDEKKRSKALQVAVGLAGVISAQVDGEKIVVVGDGIDSVALTIMLRKKMGFAELVSVVAAEEKKEEIKEEKEEIKDGANNSVQLIDWPRFLMPPQPYIYEIRDPYCDSCSIM